MEQNDTFKSVEAKIKKLEDQLSLCDETIKQCEQSGMQRGEGRGRKEGLRSSTLIHHIIRKGCRERH